ncbi:DUF6351 family protein [Sinimarinibacterium sp. NLF-5-8]|uniref:DUF6351 family protein n=1 Tax=Sinimarinibacterium sp. NLF-5-8 TaxID=2698684 RepID=UPI00137BFAFD|nr:DUF6351 family protein [Sinimarinibacterium sp. NLF-5-8]QHS09531.1 hypothetical protein GT972_04725 [Sinimarinibacterium sp. NLF-5-8]
MNCFQSRWLVAVITAVGLSACGSSQAPETSPNTGNGLQLKVLSNRADLISGDDALIELAAASGADLSQARVSLNGQDVSAAFAPNAQGQWIGLVEGLRLGNNTLEARDATLGSARVTLTNHPQGGPLIAGPQLQPWGCQDGALDAQCNQPPVFTWFYQSSNPLKQGLQPYDPENPARDVATVTTEQGQTLPFIVRVETGYQDRDQYAIAVLYQPDQPWDARTPQPQFNRKLVINHGFSCGLDHRVGTAPSVISYNPMDAVTGALPGGIGDLLPLDLLISDATVYALGQGFAVMSTALNYSGHNCNIALQAESLIMAKEHLIEAYGPLRYTVGQGCSGGSITQYWLANAYPGIYQGILPTCSFPDAWSTATQFADYHLLLNYFGNPLLNVSGGLWTELQMADVQGHITTLNSEISELAQFHVAVPTDPCAGVSDEQRYHPETNPSGTRCTIHDAAINVFAPRPPELWQGAATSVPSEAIAAGVNGHGFAGFPVDNVGVQYGLDSLKRGIITPAMFVDLNEKIGGLNVDTEWMAERTPAVEPALTNGYRSGMINQANHLDSVAVIDCRGPDPGFFHDAYRAFATRARLDRAHGNHNNMVIWEGAIPIIGDIQCGLNSFKAMNRWLSAAEQDTRAQSLAQKLTDAKPADITDQCWSGVGIKLTNQLCPSTTGLTEPLANLLNAVTNALKLPIPDLLGTVNTLDLAVVSIYRTPRMVAGDAITTDTNKCQLKPLDRADPDYGNARFSDEQWQRLQATFPTGVCDFTLPGVSQQPTVAWQTYQDASGNVIYGGQALPAAPANSGSGWASPAFAPFATP